MLFADEALKLFNSDPEVISYGRNFILWLSPFYIPFCFSQICGGALRGAGDAMPPAVISVGSFVFFRQLYLFIGTKFITSPIFVGMAYPAGWVVASALMYIVYKSGRWERKLAVRT